MQAEEEKTEHVPTVTLSRLNILYFFSPVNKECKNRAGMLISSCLPCLEYFVCIVVDGNTLHGTAATRVGTEEETQEFRDGTRRR